MVDKKIEWWRTEWWQNCLRYIRTRYVKINKKGKVAGFDVVSTNDQPLWDEMSFIAEAK